MLELLRQLVIVVVVVTTISITEACHRSSSCCCCSHTKTQTQERSRHGQHMRQHVALTNNLLLMLKVPPTPVYNCSLRSQSSSSSWRFSCKRSCTVLVWQVPNLAMSGYRLVVTAPWRVERTGYCPLNCSLLEKFLIVQRISCKNTKFGTANLRFLGDLKDRLKFWAPVSK